MSIRFDKNSTKNAAEVNIELVIFIDGDEYVDAAVSQLIELMWKTYGSVQIIE